MVPLSPLPLIVIPDLLLPDVEAVLTHAVRTGVALRAPAPGVLDLAPFAAGSAELREAVRQMAPLVADCLRATRAATPMLATTALWWDVRMFRASRATRQAIAAASQHRLEQGVAPLRARHLLAAGDVAFAPPSSAASLPLSPLR